MKTNSLLSLAVVVLAAACGGTSGQAADPRCTALCEYQAPAADAYGAYCSEASANACADTCMARISGSSNLCQTCLLEGSSFGATVSVGGQCDPYQCVYGTGATACTIPFNATDAQKLACWRQAYPPMPVECQPDFETVSRCAGVCNPGSNN